MPIGWNPNFSWDLSWIIMDYPYSFSLGNEQNLPILRHKTMGVSPRVLPRQWRHPAHSTAAWDPIVTWYPIVQYPSWCAILLSRLSMIIIHYKYYKYKHPLLQKPPSIQNSQKGPFSSIPLRYDHDLALGNHSFLPRYQAALRISSGSLLPAPWHCQRQDPARIHENWDVNQ